VDRDQSDICRYTQTTHLCQAPWQYAPTVNHTDTTSYHINQPVSQSVSQSINQSINQFSHYRLSIHSIIKINYKEASSFGITYLTTFGIQTSKTIQNMFFLINYLPRAYFYKNSTLKVNNCTVWLGGCVVGRWTIDRTITSLNPGQAVIKTTWASCSHTLRLRHQAV